MKATYKKTVLNNRIRVISEKIGSVRSVSIGFWADVGSRDEKEQEKGISHFIEHMTFKGTKKRSPREIAQSLESLGGHLNAFTSREQTCYYAKILDEHLPIAVDVIADIITNPLFDPADVEKEKKVISEEIKDVQDSPGDLIHDLFADTLWQNHPLGQPIMGSIPSISKFTQNNLFNFMHHYYTPDKIVIAASGNVNHSELVSLIEDKFHLKKTQSNSHNRVAPKLKDNVQVVKRVTAQTHVCLGVTSYPFDHPLRHEILILNNILGGGMSSRLFQSIRENSGMAYSIYSFIDFFVDSGVVGVYLGTSPKQVVESLNLVLKEIAAIKKGKFTKNELYHAKSQLKGNLMLGLESTSSRMNRLARHELFLNKYVSLDETIKAINRVKEKDVQDVARDLFRGDKLNLTVLGAVSNNLKDKINWDILN